MIEDPDFWYIVTHTNGRISKCHNWFQAYNELSMPGASGSIKHRGYVLLRRDPNGVKHWPDSPNLEPGFDLDVEEP